MIKNPVKLSIITPAFNEGELLKKIIKITLRDAKTMLGEKFEIILIDDGSTDKTRLIARQLVMTDKRISLIRHDRRQGFGAAMYSGIKRAKYDLITFIPADGQVLLTDLITPLKKAANCDVLITYRLTKKDYTLFRHLLSQGFKLTMKIFFGLSFRDYNWVQIYKKKIFNRIHPESKGVFILGEIVVKANKLKLKLTETEVIYRPRISGISKNANVKVAVKTLGDLISVWLKEELHFFRT